MRDFLHTARRGAPIPPCLLRVLMCIPASIRILAAGRRAIITFPPGNIGMIGRSLIIFIIAVAGREVLRVSVSVTYLPMGQLLISTQALSLLRPPLL